VTAGVSGVVVGVLILVAVGTEGSALLVSALLITAGLFVANAGRQRLRARRVGRRANRCHWASVCYRSDNQYMLRAFVVDDDGVHLRTLGGRGLAEWPWPALAGAVAMPVSVGSNERPGVTLETADPTRSVSFAFPPVTGVGVSAAAADRAAQAVRQHLPSR
jgi:hypothetical protein